MAQEKSLLLQRQTLIMKSYETDKTIMFMLPPFEFETGCSVILKNGGEIIYTKHMPTLTFPVGLKLTINEGKIRYVRDFWE